MGETAKIATPVGQKEFDGTTGKIAAAVGSKAARRATTIFEQEIFQSMLTRERWRAERSRKPFVLMLLGAHHENRLNEKVLLRALSVVGARTRQTDLVGWYKQGSVVGVIFTELGGDEKGPIVQALSTKFRTTLYEKL